MVYGTETSYLCAFSRRLRGTGCRFSCLLITLDWYRCDLIALVLKLDGPVFQLRTATMIPLMVWWLCSRLQFLVVWLSGRMVLIAGPSCLVLNSLNSVDRSLCSVVGLSR